MHKAVAAERPRPFALCPSAGWSFPRIYEARKRWGERGVEPGERIDEFEGVGESEKGNSARRSITCGSN